MPASRRRDRSAAGTQVLGDLVELDAMGVSAPVIDLVVAASYPKTFVIDAEGATTAIAFDPAALHLMGTT